MRHITTCIHVKGFGSSVTFWCEGITPIQNPFLEAHDVVLTVYNEVLF